MTKVKEFYHFFLKMERHAAQAPALRERHNNPGPELDIKIYMFFFILELKCYVPFANPKAPGRALGTSNFSSL